MTRRARFLKALAPVSPLLVVPLLLVPATAQATGQTPGVNGKIAFTSDRDGFHEIHAMNPNGTGQTNLTTNTSADQEPTWAKVPVRCGGRFATISGGSGNDVLTGTSGADVIHGLGA